MPYDWTTGQAVYGPRWGPTTLPASPSYIPPKPPYHDPRTGWRPGDLAPPQLRPPGVPQGGTKPVVTKKPTSTAPPTDPYAQWIKMVQSYMETPAQMEARVNREIAAQIAAQKKVMDDEYAKQRADALASFQAQSLAGAAAAALNKDLFASVGGEFNAAAGEMKGLAHGLSKNAQGATAGDVSAANAALGTLGNAPVTEGGTFGVGGGKQQGVEEYRGGTLPGQMFGTQGEAANFGLAGMIGAQALEATQTAQAALIKTERDINDAHSKAIDSLNAGRLDLYHKYMTDAKDGQIKWISLLQGLTSAKAAAGVKVPTTRLFGNVYKQWDPTTQTWVPIDKKPAKPGTVKTFKGTDGRTYVLHPNGTATLVPGQSGPKPPGGTYRFKGTNGVTYEVGSDGVARPIPGQPGPKAPTTKGALTDLQIKNMVESWATGKPTKANTVPVIVGHDPVSKKPIVKMLKQGQSYTDLDTGKTVKVPGAAAGATGQRSYQQVLKTLVGLGVEPVRAKTVLDTYYRRGTRGRPYLDVFQRQALQKAGSRPTARYLTQRQIDTLLDARPELDPENNPDAHAGRGYITQTQLAALQKAGVPVPQGYWIAIPDPSGKTRNLVRVLLIKETFD